MRTSWIALTLSIAPAASRANDVAVEWRGEKHTSSALPAALPAAARACVEHWSAWALANDHRFELDDAGRVLLVTPSWNPNQARQRELMRATVARFDALLPAPQRKPEPAAPPTSPGPAAPSVPDQHPEDPEAPPPGLDEYLRSGAGGRAWGTETVALDTETVALFVLRDVAAYTALLDQLGRERAHLAKWSTEARAFTGFVLEFPLCGAYLLTDAAQEEWNPDNELVNRLSQLLVLRRFGQQPNWILQGVAWCIELEILGAIYCFPYRQGFVSVDEHRGWDVELGKRLTKRRAKPIEPSEFAAWKRGIYDEQAAKLAWGIVAYVVQESPAELAPLLEDLRLVRARENKKDAGEGRWERDVAYQVEVATQARLLDERFGADLLAKVADRYMAIAREAAEREREEAERERKKKK